MWGWLFIALAGIATALTYVYAVREDALPFSTSMAAVIWGTLSIQSSLTLATDSGTTTVALGAERYLFAALALLSLLALTGVILGQYPADRTEQSITEVPK